MSQGLQLPPKRHYAFPSNSSEQHRRRPPPRAPDRPQVPKGSAAIRAGKEPADLETGPAEPEGDRRDAKFRLTTCETFLKLPSLRLFPAVVEKRCHHLWF